MARCLQLSACVAVLLFLTSLSFVHGDFRVELRLDAFDNPKGQIQSGYCCDFRGPKGDCNCGACVHAYHCDFKFRICVEPESAPVDMTKCSTGWKNTGIIRPNTDSITFAAETVYGDWTNGQNVSFAGPYEPFRLKFHVTDDDTRDDDDVADWLEASSQFSPNPTFGQRYLKKTWIRRKTATTIAFAYQYAVHCAPGYEGEKCEKLIIQRDCAGWKRIGMEQSGVYTIAIGGDQTDTTSVYCDMETNGGGWTVFQRRISNMTSFDRTLADYQKGFGDVNGSAGHWLGLNTLSSLTDQPQTLRIELSDCQDGSDFVEYSGFKVTNEADGYRLWVSNMTEGSAGDSLLYAQNVDHVVNGRPFSTYDHDVDEADNLNCAALFRGGWWYNKCTASNLNGLYYPECRYSAQVTNGIYWSTWERSSETDGFYSARQVEMKFRPANF